MTIINAFVFGLVPCFAVQKNKDLMKSGRKEIAETEAALERSRRQVEETIQIGAQVRLDFVSEQ